MNQCAALGFLDRAILQHRLKRILDRQTGIARRRQSFTDEALPSSPTNNMSVNVPPISMPTRYIEVRSRVQGFKVQSRFEFPKVSPEP